MNGVLDRPMHGSLEGGMHGVLGGLAYALGVSNQFPSPC